MEELERKAENPIEIQMVSMDLRSANVKYKNKTYGVDPGFTFADGIKHYGIRISAPKSEHKTSVKTYKTQCEIEAITTLNGDIVVFEKNKYYPWKITPRGTVVSAARFRLGIEKDMAFLKSMGIEEREEIQNLNRDAEKEIEEREEILIKNEENKNRRRSYNYQIHR